MSPHHFLFLASSRNCRTQRIRGAGDSNRMYIAPIVGLLTLPSSGPHSSLQVDWTIHPTPAGISSILQLVMAISHIMLDWSHRVFDPQTKSEANGRPRLLTMDGFGPINPSRSCNAAMRTMLFSVDFPLTHPISFGHATSQCLIHSRQHIAPESRNGTSKVQTL